MVSKTHKQKQKRQEILKANAGVLPPVVPSEPKSIHLKKTRPNMKSKKKIRLGLECPVDIYSGFEDVKGVMWHCPTCQKGCRVVGFCVDCASGTKSKIHSGLLMSRETTSAHPRKSSTAKMKITSIKKKKLKMKK